MEAGLFVVATCAASTFFSIFLTRKIFDVWKESSPSTSPWDIFLGLGTLFATCGWLLPVFGLRLGAMIGILCCLIFYAEGRHYLNIMGVGKKNEPILQQIRSKFTDPTRTHPIRRSPKTKVTSLATFRDRRDNLTLTPPTKTPDDDPPPRAA